MFDYNRMRSILENEFTPCGQVTLEALTPSIVQKFQMAGIPVATKSDSIKSGLLAKDPCVVVYNPQNLNYHTIVLVIRTINTGRVISVYSAGSAAGQHIGGGILNVEHQSNKLKGMLKSSKQKEAEEDEYNSRAFGCIFSALASHGIYAR
ncbi:hypothetical protein [Faecalicatena orotica]|uniref:hypothetical protein n=1 Tax=Faecalicatena orotica TaxID=1544 RepID=UPI0032177EF1